MTKVLIVDDDINVYNCLNQCVNWSDLSLEAPEYAPDGLVAFDMIVDNDINIVITDLKMPISDGVDLCENIFKANITSDIILLSGYEDFEAARSLYKYNVHDYILKPITPQVISYLEDILRKINTRNQQEKSYFLLINSVEFKQHVQMCLQKNDIAYFERLFNDAKVDLAQSYHTALSFCSKLLSLLCEFLYENQSSPQNEKYLNEIIDMNSTEMIDCLWSKYENVFQHAAQQTYASYNSIAEDVKAYIAENYSNPLLSTNMVSKQFFFSLSHIMREFKNATGMTINEYITMHRMDSAKSLLKSTDLNISDISHKVGYQSDNYFVKLFKRKFNQTPGDYRRKHKKIKQC